MTTLFAIGSNDSGQLGIGHHQDVSVPKQVLFENEGISSTPQVRAGSKHTLLLASGEIYFSGDVRSGACGLVSPSVVNEVSFQKIHLAAEESSPLHKPITSHCAVTWAASIIVQRDENAKSTKVYTFGIGDKGELGQGKFLFRSSKAQLIQDFPPKGTEVVDLAASVSHVVAVLDNGDVYGWGNGRKGQLGLPDSFPLSPRKIDGVDFKVVRAVCGKEFTYLLGDPENGHHVVLGLDKWKIISNAPASVVGWKDVGASWATIFVLQKDGKLLSWGRGDLGQLAPPELPELSQIAIGSEHALAYSVDEGVLAWGWGEHGNCGPLAKKDEDVKGRWKVVVSSKYLPPSSKISGIGAGYATSWICLSS
ncbi:regulator of chromosome condensation 1/beta-lactamase-inhibitor protein II [Amylocarpus encephaloides]|uniref:Regulator of chromosome condensation 1/beta-lactamase-inhibitor protein II n=1 Tax=Amylocarpus encephaloides TaxID=45428 RepID=A0A9P7YP21_9HELO|nr:regulator of chromosome condensation 1/beta-lactamase-inhibitor protein II [Amylocarpus encephaloides]